MLLHVTTALVSILHTVIAEDGQVFIWGYPQHGRLAHSLASSTAEVPPFCLQRDVYCFHFDPHDAV